MKAWDFAGVPAPVTRSPRRRHVARSRAPAARRPPDLHHIVDHSGALISFWDGERRCSYANAGWQAAFGVERSRLAGHVIADVAAALGAEAAACIDAAFHGQAQVFECELPWQGLMRPALATCTPLPRNGASAGGIVLHVTDVAPLKRTESALRKAHDEAVRQAGHDPLTGLPNRRLLTETIERAIAAAHRQGHQLALMSIDIDHFKAVNDRHGHAAGDRLLREVARRLQHGVRACDSVFRVGGDEFVALFPSVASAQEAQALAQRLLEAARQPLADDGALPAPTLSIGLALLPQHGPGVAALLGASDRALYQAKHAGRDCLVTAV